VLVGRPILRPKCNGGSPLCSVVSVGLSAGAGGFHPSASPGEDLGPYGWCRSYGELGRCRDSRVVGRWFG
jgi:hypothetical protein